LFRDANPDGTVGSDTIIETLKLVRRTVTDDSVVRSIVGVLLIAFAQIFTATQFVLEEYILEKYAMEPLKVVGYEGLFGFLVTLFGMVVLHFTIGRTDAGRYGYFDAEEGLREMGNKNVWVTSLLIMVSIGFVFLSTFLPCTLPHTILSTVKNSHSFIIFISTKCKDELTNNHDTMTAHSTFSVFPSPVPSLPPPVLQLTPAVRSLFGLYLWHLAGKRSNGSKSLDSVYWFMEHSCSMRLFNHP